MEGNKAARIAKTSITKRNILNSFSVTRDNIPTFYVFNYEGGGWAVVAADKRLMPVLAYSETGSYYQNSEAKPTGLLMWEKTSSDIVTGLRTSNAPVGNPAIVGEWTTTQCIPDPARIDASNATTECRSPDEFVSSTIVGPLLSTAWNQGCDYNTFCPPAANGPCGFAWAGCVPVSISQVVRYWQSPTRYNYAIMPNNSGNNEIARLMNDAGNGLPSMKYSGDGSSASMSDVDDTFRNTFGYRSASYIRNYGSSGYLTVMNNLSNRQPVILGGCANRDTFIGIPYRYTRCHAWVCDGFTQSSYVGYTYLTFHMNWGWGGDFNGWYAFNDWTIRLPNGTTLNYQYAQDAVVGIRP